MRWMAALLVCAALSLGASACSPEERSRPAATSPSAAEHTCPACGGTFDAHGKCPRCGMDLVPAGREEPPPRSGG